MKRFYLSLLAVMICVYGYGQTPATPAVDTQYSVQLGEFAVTARWKNDTERYRYNQLKYYVTTVMPYVNAASKLFKEIDAKLDDPELKRRERKQYVKGREQEMREQFEDKVRKLNVTQGGLLVKLIARQTQLNLYDIVKEVKNPFEALKWQAWARVNGFNLDRKYHPEEERTLELIMEDLGYPLPASYAAAQ